MKDTELACRIENLIQELEVLKNEYNYKLEEKKQTINELIQSLEQTKKNTEHLPNQAQELSQKINENSNRVSQLTMSLQQAQRDLANMQDQICYARNLSDRICNFEKKMANVQLTLDENTQFISDDKERIRGLQAKINETEEQAIRLDFKIKSLGVDVDQKQKNAQQAQNQLTDIKRDIIETIKNDQLVQKVFLQYVIKKLDVRIEMPGGLFSDNKTYVGICREKT